MDTTRQDEPSNNNILGERLKYLRKKMNLNQEGLSELINITQSTISSYESGKTYPSLNVIINIAEKCNVSIDWLCGRDEPQKIKTLGDVMSFFFELYEINEIDIKTTINNIINDEDPNETDDNQRNWIQLMFYYNENLHDEKFKYSNDFCSLLENVNDIYSKFITFDYPANYYEAQKKKYIEMYDAIPVTKIDSSSMSEDERIKLKMEYLKKEIKRLEEKSKKFNTNDE